MSEHHDERGAADEEQRPTPAVDESRPDAADDEPRPDAADDQPRPDAADEAQDAAPTATRPGTGDRDVDDALAAFDRTLEEGTGAHVAAAAEAHRALQARLTTPPAQPPAPGRARPGPPR